MLAPDASGTQSVTTDALMQSFECFPRFFILIMLFYQTKLLSISKASQLISTHQKAPRSFRGSAIVTAIRNASYWSHSRASRAVWVLSSSLSRPNWDSEPFVAKKFHFRKAPGSHTSKGQSSNQGAARYCSTRDVSERRASRASTLVSSFYPFIPFASLPKLPLPTPSSISGKRFFLPSCPPTHLLLLPPPTSRTCIRNLFKSDTLFHARQS